MNDIYASAAFSAAFRDAKAVVIFGGTGFIGTHLAQYLLQVNPSVRIVLFDLFPPRHASYTRVLDEGIAKQRVLYTKGDVRKSIRIAEFTKIDIIFNLAAVHREPGHEASEYYETNIPGAQNVCSYAESVDCSQIVFTSSISPYGPAEEEKTEFSEPKPQTPYGESKLAAEKIHEAWQAKEPNRSLLIMRPGVVFGPGEGGNVTRLIRSLVRGYFFYMGNRDTRKAGGYVKELCRSMDFSLFMQETQKSRVSLVNFSLNPSPRLEDFVTAISSVAGLTRKPISIPRFVLLGVSYPIDLIAKILRISQPISPVRVRKLFRSTNVRPTMLASYKYPYLYSLEEVFADWKVDSPADFAK